MASVYKQSPASPKQAARRRAPVDKLMEPALFKALAEPTRAKLLGCLIKCSRPCSVTEIAECCEIDFSVVARHLSMMARSGLLDAQKEGRTVWYTARSAELAERFRAIAAAIEEWKSSDCCDDDSCCGDNCCG